MATNIFKWFNNLASSTQEDDLSNWSTPTNIPPSGSSQLAAQNAASQAAYNSALYGATLNTTTTATGGMYVNTTTGNLYVNVPSGTVSGTAVNPYQSLIISNPNVIPQYPNGYPIPMSGGLGGGLPTSGLYPQILGTGILNNGYPVQAAEHQCRGIFYVRLDYIESLRPQGEPAVPYSDAVYRLLDKRLFKWKEIDLAAVLEFFLMNGSDQWERLIAEIEAMGGEFV